MEVPSQKLLNLSKFRNDEIRMLKGLLLILLLVWKSDNGYWLSGGGTKLLFGARRTHQKPSWAHNQRQQRRHELNLMAHRP